MNLYYEKRGEDIVVRVIPQNSQDQRLLTDLTRDGVGVVVKDEVDDKEHFMIRPFTRESYDYLVEVGFVDLPTFEGIIAEAERFTRWDASVEEGYAKEYAENLRQIEAAKEAHPEAYAIAYDLAYPVAYKAAKEAFDIATPLQKIRAEKKSDARTAGEYMSLRGGMEVISNAAFDAAREAFATANPEKAAIMEAASEDDTLPLDMWASMGGLKEASEDAVKSIVDLYKIDEDPVEDTAAAGGPGHS